MSRRQAEIIDLLGLDETKASIRARLKDVLTSEDLDKLIPERLRDSEHNKRILNYRNWDLVSTGKDNDVNVVVRLEYKDYPGLLIKMFGIYFFEDKSIVRYGFTSILNERVGNEKKKRTVWINLTTESESEDAQN